MNGRSRMSGADWAALMPNVARRLLGEPNKRTQRNGGEVWRYSGRGGLDVKISGAAAGGFYCHATGEHGGVIQFVAWVNKTDADAAGE